MTNCSRYSNFPINFIGLWVATDLLRWGRRGAIAGNGAIGHFAPFEIRPKTAGE
ncbi:hypothetical protein [Planktothricoides raciborskii]|uniref:hypothetical protein n=1 Tax=Planktothricoides raciborskii TaxID=132608 RepID=UPI0016858003|nr:hypothetical protein [Planktothricoides raciborskii]MBD2581020.1 hypothetical protein [Planktothricoides raciborskii FACHB-1261]